ncbi:MULTISPECIES: universal stress protein [Corynebacterium]|uniref:universal stress protein n=1 Tax=Corynebacterium TaxID=1716 RepID=UPI00124C0286|nr:MULTISPECIES: universal stress protein [Corynebacterium]
MPDSRLRVLIAWQPDAANNEILDAVAWLHRSGPITVRAISAFTRPWPQTSLSKLGGKYKKWLKKQEEASREVVTAALLDAGVDKDCFDSKLAVFADGSSEPHLLTQAAKDFHADIILLGPAQAAPKGRYLAGTTADALLHASPYPLGLIPREVKLGKKGVNRVSCALTEEAGSAAVFDHAAAVAEIYSVPLRIVAFVPDRVGNALKSTNSKLESVLADDAREHALANLDRARDSVVKHHPELQVETELATGSGWSEAMDAVKWKKSDLLVVGSEDSNPIARVFMGSHTSAVLKHARVPVMIYPTTT